MISPVNVSKSANLVTCTEEILNEKVHFFVQGMRLHQKVFWKVSLVRISKENYWKKETLRIQS